MLETVPEVGIFPDQFPQDLLFVREQMRIPQGQLEEAIDLVDLPHVPGNVSDGDPLVCRQCCEMPPFFDRHELQALFNGPLDEARERPPLPACCQFCEIVELRVQAYRHRFRAVQKDVMAEHVRQVDIIAFPDGRLDTKNAAA
jgi:hypothetical protein